MGADGWNLHPLHGELRGHWSVKVNGNWRLTFRFDGEDAILVDYQDYHWLKEGEIMSQMYNPAHPGRVLREWLGGMRVVEAAARLHVSRVTLSRILNGRAGISAEMSLRLADALGTNPVLWIDLQTQYDLWRARRKRRPKIERFKRAA
jgi:antitoxin HigA-1